MVTDSPRASSSQPTAPPERRHADHRRDRPGCTQRTTVSATSQHPGSRASIAGLRPRERSDDDCQKVARVLHPTDLAPKTVNNSHATLRPALDVAMRWGYVVRNVADAVDLPKVTSPEMQAWSPEPLRTFLAHVRTDGCSPRECGQAACGCALQGPRLRGWWRCCGGFGAARPRRGAAGPEGGRRRPAGPALSS
jgi:hypothetical protein